MKEVLIFWQKIHYNLYKFNCFTQIYIFGLPITLLLKNKYIVKQYEKKGIKNPSDIVRKTLTNPKTSTVNWLTDGGMILLIGLIIFSLLNFITAIAGYMLWANWSFLVYFIIIVIPSILINYFALWKNDRYLIYYKEFEKEPKRDRLKWAWISFSTIVIIVTLLIISFIIMTNNIEQ
jgi:hypothetical protein